MHVDTGAGSPPKPVKQVLTEAGASTSVHVWSPAEAQVPTEDSASSPVHDGTAPEPVMHTEDNASFTSGGTSSFAARVKRVDDVDASFNGRSGRRRSSGASDILKDLNASFNLKEQHSDVSMSRGCVPSAADQLWLDRVIAGKIREEEATLAHMPETKAQRALTVLRQYPMHCLMTNIMCILPILAGCVPIVIGTTHARLMVRDLPNVSATYNDMDHLGSHLPRLAPTIASHCLTPPSPLAE